MEKKRGNEKIIIVLTISLFLALSYFCLNLFNLLEFRKVQAVSTISNNSIPKILKNKNPINIDKIIKENKNIDTREEMIYEEQDLEYNTEYINNEDLPSGTIHVSQIGITGTQDVITIKKFRGDELVSEQIVASNVKKASIDKIVEIGTGRRQKQI